MPATQLRGYLASPSLSSAVRLRPSLREPSLRRGRLLDAGPIGWPPLVLIQGGKGAGKTTAALHLADAQAGSGVPVVWADLSDEGITNAGEFWSWLLSVLQRAGVAPADTSTSDIYIGARGRALDAARAAGAFVLVLDGYDTHSGAEVGESLVRSLEMLPLVRLVVAGPHLGALARPRVRSRLPVMMLDDRALAFTVQEFDHLLDLRFPEWGEPQRADARRGFQLIGDGWPLATNTLFSAWAESPTKPLVALAEWVLPRLANDMLDVILESGETSSDAIEATWISSYFAEMSAEMLGRLLNLPLERAQAILADLATGTLRRRYDRDGTTWYSQHPLVTEQLRRRTHRGAEPPIERRRTLARALAVSHPEEAQRAALAAEDWETLESLLARRFNEELLTIDSWLLIDAERVPLLVRPRVPLVRLLSLMGDYQVPRGRADSLHRDLRKLVSNADVVDEVDSLPSLTIVFVAMVASRLAGDEPNARRLVVELEEGIERLQEAEAHAAAITIASMMIQVILTLIYLEDWDGAENRLNRLRSRPHLLDDYMSARLAALQCAVSVIRGDMIAANRHLRECEDVLALNPYLMRSAGDNYRFALGVTFMEAGDYRTARLVFGDLVARERFNETWAIRTWVLVQLCRMEEGADAAYDLYLRQLDVARPNGKAMPNNRRMLRNLGASLRWQTGRGSQQAPRRIGDDLSYAYRAIDRGDLEGAVAIASGIVSSARRTGFHRLQVEALLLLAEALRAQGDSVAEATRREADRLSERYGMSLLPSLTIPEPSTASRRRVVPLTRTEVAVLQQVSESGTASAAADSLHLSVHTVRDHLKTIYQKLGVNRRSDALTVASRLGMIFPARSGVSRPVELEDTEYTEKPAGLV